MNIETTKLVSLLETLIFVADKPIKREHLAVYLTEYLGEPLTEDQISEALDALRIKHAREESGIRLEEIAEGFQFLSSPLNFELVKLYLKDINKSKLSKTALETLSIIAYKQPVTKSIIEQIRGVSSDYMLQKLLEKELVEISGRSDAPGRPLLYSTTTKFMDHFGLKSIKDLPKLSEFEIEDNSVGLPGPVDQAPKRDEEE